MIELPEATVIAQQMAHELTGKRIVEGLRGNSPHKFAFYSGEPDYYAATLADKVVGPAYARGGIILMPVEPGYVLGLGGGGERILYHRDAATLPKKHQLLLRFGGDSYLSVTVSGWGAAWLSTPEGLATHAHMSRVGISPLDEAFTEAYFLGQFAALPASDPRAIKFFMISEPGVFGMGNGCLQDILWRAKLHPRRRAAEVTPDEQRALYVTTREIMQEMAALGGRDSEFDLYNQPGRYRRALDSRSLGQPCPACGAIIEKIAFLGGASYLCPGCQK